VTPTRVSRSVHLDGARVAPRGFQRTRERSEEGGGREGGEGRGWRDVFDEPARDALSQQIDSTLIAGLGRALSGCISD